MTAKETEKSSLAQSWRAISISFVRGEPTAPLTSPGARANPRAVGGGGGGGERRVGGVEPVPPPQRPGPRGGREGTVPYKPWPSGLVRSRRLRFSGQEREP